MEAEAIASRVEAIASKARSAWSQQSLVLAVSSIGATVDIGDKIHFHVLREANYSGFRWHNLQIWFKY